MCKIIWQYTTAECKMRKEMIEIAILFCYNGVMDKQIRFYVSPKNVLTWLMALCMAASAVTRIVFACMKGMGEAGYVWGQVVLPAFACLLFAAICLLNGKEQYYKTSIPVFCMALYLCFYTASSVPGLNAWYLFLDCFLYFTIAVLYCITVSGRQKQFWALLPAYVVPALVRAMTASGGMDKALIPDCLFLLGLVIAVFATRIHNDGKYHPTWGDRPDGRRVRTLPPMSQMEAYIMVNRNGSSNLFTEAVEITNMERYIRQKRKEGLTNFGITHVILASYARAVSRYPALNRFIAGQKVYSRGDDIQICMTIKKEMTTSAPDSVVKLHLKPTDTSKEVYEKFQALVDQVKNEPLNSDFDNTARYLTMIPGLVLKFTVWLLKTMDYFGVLPGFLLEVSPFHGSMFITSMGSLGIPSIYHHLYDFGNLPVFVAFSAKRRSMELNMDGEVVQKKYVDLNMTLDERTCDGFYYATVIKHMNRVFQHPEVLDQPPETVTPDID